MNKAKVIGLAVTGLAVVGGLALFNYYKKPKETRGGFLSADGTRKSQFKTQWCAQRQTNGSVLYTSSMISQDCPRGFRKVAFYGDRTGV
jgi:hypothetical protein